MAAVKMIDRIPSCAHYHEHLLKNSPDNCAVFGWELMKKRNWFLRFLLAWCHLWMVVSTRVILNGGHKAPWGTLAHLKEATNLKQFFTSTNIHIVHPIYLLISLGNSLGGSAYPSGWKFSLLDMEGNCNNKMVLLLLWPSCNPHDNGHYTEKGAVPVDNWNTRIFLVFVSVIIFSSVIIPVWLSLYQRWATGMKAKNGEIL